MRKRQSCVVAAVALGATACATIRSTTSYSQELVSRRRSIETEPFSLKFDATPSLQGAILTIELRSQETCRSTVVPVYRKTEHVTRELDSDNEHQFHPGYSFLLGGLFVGLGVGIYADADSIAARSQADPDPTTPDDAREAGLGIGAIGLPFIAAGIIDLIRLRDTDRVVGNVKGEGEVSTATCHQRKVADTEVVLTSDRVGWRGTSTTNRSGVARFSLTELAEDAFSTAADEWGGELRFSLAIAKNAIEVTLSKDETAQLLAVLAAAPTSRVAKERAAETLRAETELAAAKAAVESSIAYARKKLAECQRVVDGGDLGAAIACLRDATVDWSAIDAGSEDIVSCLTTAQAGLDAVKACAAWSERTDDEVIKKSSCVRQFEYTAAAWA